MGDGVGGGEEYPVCGAQVQRPLRIRLLRYASLLLASVGLVLLYLYSLDQDIPSVRVGEITPAMNFACVRMAGEVTADAYVFKSGGVVFNLRDSSGEIAVMGGRAQAEALASAGKLPRRGDRVEVTGALSVSAGQDPKLRMQSAARLVLHRKRNVSLPAETASCLRLQEITAARKGMPVTVAGTIRSVHIPGPGARTPYVLMIEEEGAELAVVFWEGVVQGLGNTLPVPGKRIRVSGRVDVYNGTVQLKVREAGDLRVVAESKP